MTREVLIFRTDRVGDLLATCPAIVSIKKSLKDCRITLVASNKNNVYAKSFDFFDEILTFPNNSLLKKINFINKLSKKKFDYIFIFDGKDRSIISSLFVKSKSKVAIFSSKKNSFFYKLFKITLIYDDEKTDLMEIFQNSINKINLNIKINNYNFIQKKKNNNFSSNIPIEKYIHFHLDEKWSQGNYIENYTAIDPSYDDFVTFLNDIAKKNMNLVITSGMLDFELLNKLKNKFFYKKNEKIFYKNYSNSSIFLIYKASLDDFESIARNAKIFISCHCGLTHIPNSFNIKIIDIIEESKKEFYDRWTVYMNNYNQIYRNKFSTIKNEVMKLID